MARRHNVLRPVKYHITLPEDLAARIDIHLFSAVEGRIPHGALASFMAEAVRNYFEPKPNEEARRSLRALGMLVKQLGGQYELHHGTIVNFDMNSVLCVEENLEKNSILFRLEAPVNADPIP